MPHRMGREAALFCIGAAAGYAAAGLRASAAPVRQPSTVPGDLGPGAVAPTDAADSEAVGVVVGGSAGGEAEPFDTRAAVVSAAPGPTRPRLLAGVFLATAALSVAYIAQAAQPLPEVGSAPSVFVLTDPAPTPANLPAASTVVNPGSPYWECEWTPVTVTLTFGTGFRWRTGQRIAVGIGSAPPVRDVSASFVADPGADDLTPGRIGPAHATFPDEVWFVVEKPPPRPQQQYFPDSPADLRIRFEAAWGSRREFGSCAVLLPALVGEAGNSQWINAAASADSAMEAAGGRVDPLMDHMPVTGGRSGVAAAVEVDRGASLPPLRWDRTEWVCQPPSLADAGDAEPNTCAAVAVVSHPAAENVRSAILLVCGALLGSGLALASKNLASLRHRSRQEPTGQTPTA